MLDFLDTKNYVLKKLWGKSHPENIHGCEEICDSVYASLRDTVELRKSHSCLLVGPRGTGKTATCRKALSRLSRNYSGEYIEIYLNGRAIPDDRVALREIAHQLDKQTSSHIEHNSLNETLRDLWALLRSQRGEESPPVCLVFYVEEADKFATTSKQNFLYTLIDLAGQPGDFGIAIVATSVRIEFQATLERRVSSRSAFRSFALNHPGTFDEYVGVVKAMVGSDGKNSDWDAAVEELARSNFSRDIYLTENNGDAIGVSFGDIVAAASSFSDLRQPVQDPLGQPESAITLTVGLSELQWAVLICAARAATRYGTEGVNLVLVLDEYLHMGQSIQMERANGSSKITGYRIWSSYAVQWAWESLQSIQLLAPLGAGWGAASDPAPLQLQMFKPEIGLHELPRHVPKDHPLYSWTHL